MPQGTYNVSKGGGVPPQDTSFRSCLCAMLIFLILCVIILLFTTQIPRNRGKYDPNADPNYLRFHDSEKDFTSSSITTKLNASEIESTTTTTTSRTTKADPINVKGQNKPLVDERNTRHDEQTENSVETFHQDNKNNSLLFERVKAFEETTTTSTTTSTSTTNSIDTNNEKVLSLEVKNSPNDQTNETNVPTTTTFTTTPTYPINVIEQNNDNRIKVTEQDFNTESPSEDQDNQKRTSIETNDDKISNVNVENISHNQINEETTKDASTSTESYVKFPTITTSTTTTSYPIIVTEQNNPNDNHIKVTVQDFDTESSSEDEDNQKNSTIEYEEDDEEKTTISKTTSLETNDDEMSNVNLKNDSHEQINEETTKYSSTSTESSVKVPTITTSTTTTTYPINVTEQNNTNDNYIKVTVQNFNTESPVEDEDNQKNSTIEYGEDDEEKTTESKTTLLETNDDKMSNVNVKNDSHEQINEETTKYASTNGENSTKVPTTTTSTKPTENNDELKQIELPKVPSEEHKTCSSAECKYISSRMLSMMNHTEDPCTNFYEYSCGGLRSNPDLLVEDLSRDVWKRILDGLKASPSEDKYKKKFRLFYESCIDYSTVPYEKRIEQAQNILMEAGDVLNFREDEEKFYNFTHLLTNSIINNSPFLFDIFVEPNEEGIMTLTLTLPPLHSPFFYPKEDTKDDCKTEITDGNISLNQIYINHQECLFRTTRDKFLNEIDYSIKEFKKLTKSQILRNRINIDFQILNITENQPSKASVRHQLLSKKFRVRTIDQLSNDFPLIDWISLISSLINPSTPISGDEKIHIYFYDHFQRLFSDLNHTYYDTQTPKKDFHNGILSIYARSLYEELVKDPAPCHREDYCLKVASRLLPEIAGKIYLDSFTVDQKMEFQRRLLTHINAIRDHLHGAIEKHNSWLDKQSRKDLIDKLQNIKFETNGGTDAKFESAYFLLDKEFTPTTSYFENAIKLNRLYRTRLYKLYKDVASKPDIIWSFLTQPHALNSIYDYNLGIVAVPFTIFSSPIMSPALPSYLSAARLGFIIAHDIGHHFDKTGITKTPLQEKSLSINLQVSIDEIVSFLNNNLGSNKSYHLPDGRIASFQLNEDEISLHIDEVLADLTGVNSALKAYKDFIQNREEELLLPWIGLSPIQTYFLTIAQMYCSKNSIEHQLIPLFEDKHLPPSQRIAFISSNSEDFTKAFSCPPGSGMNPSFKIETFPKLYSISMEDIN